MRERRGDVSRTWAHWEWDLGLQLHATHGAPSATKIAGCLAGWRLKWCFGLGSLLVVWLLRVGSGLAWGACIEGWRAAGRWLQWAGCHTHWKLAH